MRYKEFNRNNVLEKCMKLFWNNGFEATPISQIVKETGVNRFSLYEEFGNKEGILYASIQLYLNRIAHHRLQALTKLEASDIEAYFMAFLQKDNTYPKGCYLIYIATEFGKENKIINEYLTTYLASLKDTYQQLATSQKLNVDLITINQLTTLYCSTMCYAIILTEEETKQYLRKNLSVILKNHLSYA